MRSVPEGATTDRGRYPVEESWRGPGTSVSVIGLARSGLSVARLMAGEGLRVLASDIAENDETLAAKGLLEGMGVEVHLGAHPIDRLAGSKFVVVSPGIPDDAPVMKELGERGVPVFSEIEVAGWYADAPIAAVTGTNGKTTTVLMVGHILQAAGMEARVCGNIGNPLSAACRGIGPGGWLVVEVSSFQLRHVRYFHPAISVILNVTADHMDRYGDFREYLDDKGRILMNVGKGDTVVYNAMDRHVPLILRGLKGRRIPFSLHELGEGVSPMGEDIVWRHGEEEEVLFSRDDLPLAGEHNLANAMAASAVARSVGVHAKGIRHGIHGITGLEHRLEPVGEVNGVRFINDSKSTNLASLRAGVEAFPGGIVLIVGGKEKGLDYSKLRDEIQKRVKFIVAMGECAGRMVEELGGGLPSCIVEGMREAVHSAFEASSEGDVVLLSPGTSSYDQYRDFEGRGADFKDEVARLGKET